jgi:hypothetical protein
MKRISILFTIASITILSLVTIPAFAIMLPASVYPGAVADPVASAQSKVAMVYFSHATLPTVREWYQQRLAKKSAAACSDRSDGCGTFQQNCTAASAGQSLTHCRDLMILKWNAIPPGGSMVDAFNAGVHIEGWQKASQPAETQDASQQMTGQAAKMMAQLNAAENQMQAAGKQLTQQIQKEGKQQLGTDVVRLSAIPDMPFGGLKQEVLAGRHSQQELETVYTKYRLLSKAFYPLHKTAKGAEPYNRWLVDKTWAQIKSPERGNTKEATQAGKDAAALARQMQKLVQQGRVKEAQMLAEQMAKTQQQGTEAGMKIQEVRNQDHWNEWIGVLKKLQAHAYSTKITIDRISGT